MSKKLKLKMVDMFEETIKELDKTESPMDKKRLAIFIADFWNKATPSLVAYADLKPDMQGPIKAALQNYKQKVVELLKNE
jgi:hypothetical protein